MTSPALSIDSLTVEYRTDVGRQIALDDVSLSVGQSEILGVVGESGCGKSTLALAILRLLPANGRLVAGRVSLEDRDVARLTDEQMRSARGRDMALIFQDPMTSLNPRLSIGRQLSQVQRSHRDARATKRAAMRQTAVERLAEVGLPNPDRVFDSYPHELSGGMRQRVVIAMALLFEPKLIIADEATSALDVTLEAQILELLLRLRDRHGTAMLFISHDLGVVSQLCDQVAVMYAGRVVEQLPGELVLKGARHPYTQALNAAVPNRRSQGVRLSAIPGRVPALTQPVQACAFAPRCVRASPRCSEEAPGWYAVDSGGVRCFAYDPAAGDAWSPRPSLDDWRVITHGAPDTLAGQPAGTTEDGDGEPLVEVRDLAVHFGAASRFWSPGKRPVRALDGVTMQLQRGSVVGIVGESGSGKTTFGETVVKLLEPTAGSIRFGGQDVTRMSRSETFAFRRRAQMIFQNASSSLSPRIQIARLLTEPYEVHAVPRAARKDAAELLDAVGLPARLGSSYPSQLSGGQARRVGIARALALEPDLVVADEPTAGLDASSSAATVNLLADLRQRTGLTIILISHNLSLVATSADQVCVMYLGRIVEQGSTDDVVRRPAHPYTKALLALAPDPEEASRTVRRRLLVPGEIPSPDAPPPGCHFHPRCPYAADVCRTVAPDLTPIGPSGEIPQLAACHFATRVQEEGQALSPT
jgi:peptide/nickel transport system ATP-binding protein